MCFIGLIFPSLTHTPLVCLFVCLFSPCSWHQKHFFHFYVDLFSLCSFVIRGTPVNRIPIMAKQVLDLYMLYRLVTEKGGLVEVINKKLWREITKGLNLPTSITSAAFTLRTQSVHKHTLYYCTSSFFFLLVWFVWIHTVQMYKLWAETSTQEIRVCKLQ